MSPHPSSRRAAAALLLAAVLAAAAPAFAGPARDVTAALIDKRIQDLSSNGLVLSFRLRVANGGRSERALVRYRYRVTVAQKEYLNLDVPLDEPLAVPAGGEIAISLPVKITYRLLEGVVGPLGDRASCQLYGDLFFRDDRGREDKAGLTLTGEFPVFQDPVVTLQPLRAADLTVGGGDLVFRAEFTNPNPYDLLVETIPYSLALAGKTVVEGEIPGDKDLPARGSKTVEAPFLLDFFESGTNLYETLKAGEVDAAFRGEIRIASVWGPLRVPFERKGRIKVVSKG